MPTISKFYGIIIRMFFKKNTHRRIFTRNMVNIKPQLTLKRLKWQTENYQDEH
jgi:hypothetical protein